VNRRTFLITSAATVTSAALARTPRASTVAATGMPPRPTRAQLEWQRDELAMFLHFGVNTFTDREWGDGQESPAIFAPARLDARQWAHTARIAGFRAMILTAKHHDGFCLWPTATTAHSVSGSAWRGGAGDVVSEFVDACRAEGLRAGLYLSPWDRNHPAYGDSPRYNDVYVAQLTELLTRYGPLAEVWFDGANGEGANGKRQVYDWPRVFGTVRRLQPHAIMFSDAGPDVRWCGNERGEAGDPNWSTIDPAAVPYPGADGPGIIDALQHGHPDGSVWRPAEVDVSIRPGWFHHPAEDDKVRDADNLLRLYVQSVGRNAKLLLNVPPTRDGLLHERDVAALDGFRDRRASAFEGARISGRHVQSSAGAEFRFDRERRVHRVRLGEHIDRGQSVADYTVSALTRDGWREVSKGTTIGYAKIDTFEPLDATALRVTVRRRIGPHAPLLVAAFGDNGDF
jgi:alpha-L-fucosidase